MDSAPGEDTDNDDKLTRSPKTKKSYMGALASKVRAGANFVVTQCLYDAEQYFDFVKECHEQGIDCPIIPGVMPIQVQSHCVNGAV